MLTIEKSETIRSYLDLIQLCNNRGIHTAVEVGVDLACSSKFFLEHWKGNMLYLVDPYEPYYELNHDRLPDLITAITALVPYHGRFKFIRKASPEAVRHIPKWERIGYVYIDGSHRYLEVKEDINAWWNILTSEGILAGHDYREDHTDVMRAVNEFAEEKGHTLFITHDDMPNWFILKDNGRP